MPERWRCTRKCRPSVQEIVSICFSCTDLPSKYFNILVCFCHYRYVVIVHPMKARSWFSTRKMVQILLAVWLVALLLSSPILYAMVSAGTDPTGGVAGGDPPLIPHTLRHGKYWYRSCWRCGWWRSSSHLSYFTPW